jgi:hypothetical protein
MRGQYVCLSLRLSRFVVVMWVGEWGFRKSDAARVEVKSEEAEELHPRYFDSIIQFCRSSRGCCCWESGYREK